MKPAGLTAESAVRWNEGVKRVVAAHPEAQPYVELRQAWQGLYRSLQDSEGPDAALAKREQAAYLKMREAYRALPTAVKVMLVL